MSKVAKAERYTGRARGRPHTVKLKRTRDTTSTRRLETRVSTNVAGDAGTADPSRGRAQCSRASRPPRPQRPDDAWRSLRQTLCLPGFPPSPRVRCRKGVCYLLTYLLAISHLRPTDHAPGHHEQTLFLEGDAVRVTRIVDLFGCAAGIMQAQKVFLLVKPSGCLCRIVSVPNNRMPQGCI